MKTIGAGLATHLAGQVTTLAMLWKVTRLDGVVKAFTNHHQAILYGGISHLSAQGFSSSSVDTQVGLNIDNLDVKGFLDALGITQADILNGKYDGSTVEVSLVNWADLTMGAVILRKGTLGEVRFGRLGFEAEVRGLIQRLHRQIGEIYAPGCRADLGDTRCGVRLNPPSWSGTTGYTARMTGDALTGSVVKPTTPNGAFFHCSVAGTSGGSEPSWNTTPGATTTDGSVTWIAFAAQTVTGTVTSTTSNRVFLDTARTQATDYFTGGLLTWTSGNNTGLSMEVKHWDGGSKTFQLMLSMPSGIQVGDSYSVSAGCDKAFATCKTKFDNVSNFRGEPHVPEKAIASVPAAAQGGGMKSNIK